MKISISAMFTSLFLFACSSAPHTSGLSGVESLKRYSEDQFSPVSIRIYYGGLTNPVANLSRNAERGVLIYTNDEESNDVKNARKLAKMLRQKFEIPNAVDEGNQRAKDVIRYYREQFGRNSYDGSGAALNMTVDVNRDFPSDPIFRHNAMWIADRDSLIFGAGGGDMKSFVYAPDVVGHEFTHAVVSATSKLKGPGQTGALNEHLADLFGEMFQWYTTGEDSRYLIGEALFAHQNSGLRNMLHPELSNPVQPTHMAQIPSDLHSGCTPDRGNDNCGVHSLNGIPNKAAATVVATLGWEKSRDVFYNTMTQRLTNTSNFADYARELRAECARLLSGDDCRVFDEALGGVGL